MLIEFPDDGDDGEDDAIEHVKSEQIAPNCVKATIKNFI